MGIDKDAGSESVRGPGGIRFRNGRRLLKQPSPAGGLPVAVPVSLPCPECRAGGYWRRMFCFTCGGAGSIRFRQQLVLNIPPGMQSGREFLLDTGDHPPGAGRT